MHVRMDVCYVLISSADFHCLQYGNILAGPQLSISNSDSSSNPTSSAAVLASATASSTPSSIASSTASSAAGTTPSSATQTPPLSLKIVNEKKKSEYVVQNLHLNTRFSSLVALKRTILSKCEDRISIESGTCYPAMGRGGNSDG